jgi:hypothetical protein
LLHFLATSNSFFKIAFAAFTAIQIALVAIAALPQTPTTRASIACAVINLIGTLAIWLLSHLEHTRAVRPSTILNIYLFFSLLGDIVRTRTLWAISQNRPFAIAFSVCVGLKTIVLLVEAIEKRGLLRQEYADYPPEATAGVYNRNFFVWLNPLLVKGFMKELHVNELDSNDKVLIPEFQQQKLLERWNKCNQAAPHSLIWIYMVHYRWYLAAAVIPRLCLIGFKFAQPFLVETAVTYLAAPDDPNSANRGYGLITAYGIVYIGIAVSTPHSFGD